MKLTRMVAVALAAVTFASMLAAPAKADIGDSGLILITGNATVGKNFKPTAPCTKQGLGEPQGKGLVFPAPVGSKANNKEAVYSLVTMVTIISGSAPVGSPNGTLNVCGRIKANAAGIGASCLSSSGWGGLGKLISSRTYKLYNVGWRSAVGGVLPVDGNYRKIPSTDDKDTWLKKEGTFAGVVVATGGLECAEEKCSDPKFCSPDPDGTERDGATTFGVVGEVETFMPNYDLPEELGGPPKQATPKPCYAPGKKGYQQGC